MKYAIVAGNHGEFLDWVEEHFIYLAEHDIAKLDASKFGKVVCVGNYSNHPLYWSDELLRFQMKVALANQDRKGRTYTSGETWWIRFLKWLGFEEGSTVNA